MSRAVNKSGLAENIVAAPPAIIIWSGHATEGAELMPSTPGQLTVKSSSEEDAAGQTGARSVICMTLTLHEGFYRSAAIKANLNGTSDSTIVLTVEDADATLTWRVFNMEITGPSGSAENNVGKVTAFIDGVPAMEIPAGRGSSEALFFTLGGDQRAVARLIEFALVDSMGLTATAHTKLMRREFGGSRIGVGPPTFLGSGQLSKSTELPIGAALNPNTDFWFEVSDLKSGPATIGGLMCLELFALPKEVWVKAP